MNKGSKGLCVTVTPSGNIKILPPITYGIVSQGSPEIFGDVHGVFHGPNLQEIFPSASPDTAAKGGHGEMEPDGESARICIGVIIQNLRQTRDHGVLRLVDQLPVSYRTLMADVSRCNVRSSGHIGLVAGPPQACSFPTFCRVSALRRLRLWGHDRVCEIAEVDERSFLAIAYTPDSEWRNRSEFPRGRRKIVEILTRKWQRKPSENSAESATKITATAPGP